LGGTVYKIYVKKDKCKLVQIFMGPCRDGGREGGLYKASSAGPYRSSETRVCEKRPLNLKRR
jgi:hypothetical protein